MGIAVLVGRLFYAYLFVMSGIGHLAQPKMMAGYAKSKGVPAAEFLVLASGLMELAGALLIAFGYQAQLGAWLIAAFLAPVTLMMHNYWTLKDPTAKMHDMVNFNKNLALLGAALLIAYFGSGPYSLRP
jgi:putative oxidoreductase